MNSASNEIVISLFKNSRDNTPKTYATNWHDLQKFFGHRVERPEKDGPAWSPAIYPDGASRSNQNVEALQLAVLDIDNGFPVESMLDKLNTLGLSGYCHSSHSHSPAKNKYRVVLPLNRTVKASEWSLVWNGVNAMMGGVLDAAAKDAARLYYRPSKPPGAEGHFFHSVDGSPVDVDQIINQPTVANKNNVAKKLPLKSGETTAGAEVLTLEAGYVSAANEVTPKSDLQETINRCSFIQYFSSPEHQNTISEPLWMAGITNTCVFENSDGFIHAASERHDAYDEVSTQARIDRYREQDYKPVTCSRIRELGFTGCPTGGCKTPSGKVTAAPAGLGGWANVTGPARRSDGRQSSQRPSTKPKHIQSFVSHFYPGSLVYVNNSFHAYSEGYWPMLDEQADIKRSIAIHSGEDAKAATLADTVTLLKAFFAKRQLDAEPNKTLICLPNGTLDTNTYELIPHSPEHWLRTRCDIPWDEASSISQWLAFLDSIFAYDYDKDQKIAFVQEFFGYCLTPDSSQHKWALMVGAGGNGKSVLLSILTALVGRTNVSNFQIERLGDENVRAGLVDKLVNISSEMTANATVSDSYLKQIVAGDDIDAERKFQAPFSFKPYVKLVAATNHMPRLLDLSDGFFRRLIILSFNRRFTEAEQDRGLVDKLMRELPGILHWAVAGLKRLREQGHFTIPPSSDAACRVYKAESDPAGLFATECLAKSAGRGMRPAEVYKGYARWCRSLGYSPMHAGNFGKRLRESGYEQKRSNGKDYWLVEQTELRSDIWELGNETVDLVQREGAVSLLAGAYSL